MKYNHKWYSVIISVLLIGFLLMLTTWVFSLVLKEFNDNRWLWDSIKAYAWAESAQELALLKIKNKWYWIDAQIDHSISTDSIILSEQPWDIWNFNKNKEAFISYDLNVLADFNSSEGKYEYSETLGSNWYSIIPLFYEQEGQAIEFVRSYNISINAWDSENIVWNLISWSEWIWNNGSQSLENGNGKNISINPLTGNPEAQDVSNQNHSTFLSTRDNAYLILFNWWNSSIEFLVTSNQKFSKPKTTILSSAQIWKYRHNLETKYDNTQFLNMLKYAVFSN